MEAKTEGLVGRAEIPESVEGPAMGEYSPELGEGLLLLLNFVGQPVCENCGSVCPLLLTPVLSCFLPFAPVKARGIIQNKAPLWKEQLEASHNPSQIMLSTLHNQGHPSGCVTPTHLDMVRKGKAATQQPLLSCF